MVTPDEGGVAPLPDRIERTSENLDRANAGARVSEGLETPPTADVRRASWPQRPDPESSRENARLLAQAAEFSSDAHIWEEATRWRQASPEQRLAETWRLATLYPWFRSMWSKDLRARAGEPEPLPADSVALLERIKTYGRG